MVMFDCMCKNTDTPSYTSNYVMVKMKNNKKKKILSHLKSITFIHDINTLYNVHIPAP